MTTEDVRDILRAVTKGNQAAWAKAHKVSPGYLSDVLTGRRAPGKPILDALGLQCEASYHWVANGEASA